MKRKIPDKYLILIGAIVLLNLIFPPPKVPSKHKFSEGEIAAYDIIAPYDFDIPKSDQELANERREIAERIPPIFDLDNTAMQTVMKKMRGLDDLLDSLSSSRTMSDDSIVYYVQKEYALDRDVLYYLLRNNRTGILERITRTIADLYAVGITDIKSPEVGIITVMSGNKEMVESMDRLYSLKEADSILGKGQRPEYQRLIAFLLDPNVIFNKEKTEARIDEVFANIPKTKGHILKGEIIIEKHKRVTQEALDIVAALEASYALVGTWGIFETLFFRNLFYVTILFLLYRFGKITRTDMYSNKKLYFLALLSAVYLILGKITYITDTLYLLPISFFIFLFALYFDIYVAIIVTLVYASVFGIIFNSTAIFTYLAVSGLVAAFSIQTINSRLSLYRPMTFIVLANIGAILFIDVYLTKGAVQLLHLGEGVLNSIIGGVLFFLLLPLFERLFDFTTDLTLLELGNLNLPLFKEMAMEAPGSYHHSIVVGNLAEAAATVIGADPVLARVGAYYHDIGKLKKPEYFIENQIGIKNPHDALKPQMSALVIISHVKDGVEMAKKMKLPKKLINIIEQHHGTTTVELFRRKALALDPELSEDTFRYPGPKPKMIESALIMIADTAEAVARSDKNITITKLKKILNQTIEKKLNDGQLDDCPLHRQDLEQIKAAYLSILIGVFHPRVDYEKNGLKTESVRVADGTSDA